MDVNELIQSMEGNFQQYNSLLNRFEDEAQAAREENRQIRRLLAAANHILDEVVDYRLKKILKEEHPYFPQINADKIRNGVIYQKETTRQLAQQFLRRRQELVRLLYAIPLDNWYRTGVHEFEGHVTFKELVRRMAEKDKQVLVEMNSVIHRDES